jgi:hypothetical protein
MQTVERKSFIEDNNDSISYYIHLNTKRKEINIGFQSKIDFNFLIPA